MTSFRQFGFALCMVVLTPPVLHASTPEEDAEAPETETLCSDKLDNDRDGMTDCADADCFADPACKSGTGPENSQERCTDWIDNDGDGAIDCDDSDCFGPAVAACQGSWRAPSTVSSTPADGGAFALPELEGGMSVEDLLGKGRDRDGERNDELCSDGIDNDGDGMTDCADYGCRFDPSVIICRGNPGMRFSIVASVAQIYEIDDTDTNDLVDEQPWDTRFSKIQLRSFGPLPYIQNSFYLISMRMEKTPRMTFAMMQIPIGKGHFFNVNSGGGGLSIVPVLSDAKQLLLDAPYYVYQGFEQGNGAAAEIAGHVVKSNRLNYRAFLAGGSGFFNGNIGGQYFVDDNTNYTWSAGGQLLFNLFGFYSRQDSPFLYTPVPFTAAITAGVKYDQRALERYPAANVMGLFRYHRFFLSAEAFAKQELEFDFQAASFVVQGAFLAVPKKLLLAADYGQYIQGAMGKPPADSDDLLTDPLDEMMWRAAVHYYFYRNIGMLSLRYQHREIQADESKGETEPTLRREARLEVQYRF